MKSQPEELDVDEKSDDSDATNSDDETEVETTSKNDTVPGLVNPSAFGYYEGADDLCLDQENMILGIRKKVDYKRYKLGQRSSRIKTKNIPWEKRV